MSNTIGFEYQKSFPEVLKRSFFHVFQMFVKRCLNEEKRPFFIARMSGIESAVMGDYLESGINLNVVDRDIIQKHSGIYCVSEEDWKAFVEMTMLSFDNADFIAVWDGECYLQCQQMYDYCKKRFQHKNTIPAQCLEPYYYFKETTYDFPSLFHGKRVLVITSHASSIEYQIVHGHVGKIFYPYDIFREPGNIQVYRSCQQHGRNCDGRSWKVHYEEMCADISKLDFDVAFIGAGGFSNLLGYFIFKHLGRSALYIGGPIQLMFGVMGRRWTGNDTIRKILKRNGKYWIRPLVDDYMNGSYIVEDECYWM